jgi:AcrR family transcriptional regulator
MLTENASPRDRILQAGLTLLETEGVEAVSTRTVSAAAAVQPPTIYRHFGDMQGLLDAVASAGFSAYLQTKAAREHPSDPVEQVREGWKLHVEFGLTHPHLYILINGTPGRGQPSPAVLTATEMMRDVMQRVAESGRLAVSVERAAAMIHAAVLGTTLSLLGNPVKDLGMSNLMLEAVLKAILTPQPQTSSDTANPQIAAHAVALTALLPKLPNPFSEAEKKLLVEWLERLSSLSARGGDRIEPLRFK